MLERESFGASAPIASVWLPLGSEDERNAAIDTDKINYKNNFLVFTITCFRSTITVSLHSVECSVTLTALIISNTRGGHRTPLLQVKEIIPSGLSRKGVVTPPELSRNKSLMPYMVVTDGSCQFPWFVTIFIFPTTDIQSESFYFMLLKRVLKHIIALQPLFYADFKEF